MSFLSALEQCSPYAGVTIQRIFWDPAFRSTSKHYTRGGVQRLKANIASQLIDLQ